MPNRLHRATISGFYFGQTIQNVFHFHSDVAVNATNLQLCLDLKANVIPKMQLIVQDAFQFVSIQAIEIRNPAPIAAHIEQVTTVGGGGVTQSHLVSSFKVRWITNRGGRRGFGKTYFGAIAWNLTSGGNNISSTGTTRLNDFINTMNQRYMGPSKLSVFQMVLVHKDVNDPPDDIITGSIYPVIGSMRRRNKLVGI